MAVTEPLVAPADFSVSVNPQMIPQAPPKGMTADEFFQLCNDETHYELIQGEIIQMAPGGGEHGLVSLEVAVVLKNYVDENDLGEMFTAEAGFILEINPHTVRASDAAFISNESLKTRKITKGFFPGAPDLAVEVLSPTDSLLATEAKARMFLRAGGKAVLVLNPADRSVRLYVPDREPAVHAPEEEVASIPSFPGSIVPRGDCSGAGRRRRRLPRTKREAAQALPSVTTEPA